jgi:hypothetical protein
MALKVCVDHPGGNPVCSDRQGRYQDFSLTSCAHLEGCEDGDSMFYRNVGIHM